MKKASPAKTAFSVFAEHPQNRPQMPLQGFKSQNTQHPTPHCFLMPENGSHSIFVLSSSRPRRHHPASL
ncbi:MULTISPECIES: hypothetical protein [unclassified Desulfovibrio]|uniref:hypothetical protein n=1 Tax=unclassified Desulfovibrio TaxID=2593640 RepID=UPI000F5E7C58|nr:MULTISPECIES: hypothetical protein [unclassified Desulfovibrio]RRD68959.1 hypothetical protein EII24_11815 [Desulfovibrio sp. OH1209_COT-279]RRD82987.1 hypothetical protein EII23_11815 [Desulfovibrio sp. OH1186_COT-070]